MLVITCWPICRLLIYQLIVFSSGNLANYAEDFRFAASGSTYMALDASTSQRANKPAKQPAVPEAIKYFQFSDRPLELLLEEENLLQLSRWVQRCLAM